MQIQPKSRNQVIMYTCLDEQIPANNEVRILDELVELILSSKPEKYKYNFAGMTGYINRIYESSDDSKSSDDCYGDHITSV